MKWCTWSEEPSRALPTKQCEVGRRCEGCLIHFPPCLGYRTSTYPQADQRYHLIERRKNRFNLSPHSCGDVHQHRHACIELGWHCRESDFSPSWSRTISDTVGASSPSFQYNDQLAEKVDPKGFIHTERARSNLNYSIQACEEVLTDIEQRYFGGTRAQRESQRQR